MTQKFVPLPIVSDSLRSAVAERTPETITHTINLSIVSLAALLKDASKAHHAYELTRDWYRLPDGSIVPTDKTATRSAPVIDFTLKGGAIVKATFVGHTDPDWPLWYARHILGTSYRASLEGR